MKKALGYLEGMRRKQSLSRLQWFKIEGACHSPIRLSGKKEALATFKNWPVSIFILNNLGVIQSFAIQNLRDARFPTISQRGRTEQRTEYVLTLTLRTVDRAPSTEANSS